MTSIPGGRAVGAAEAPYALPRTPDPFHPSATAWSEFVRICCANYYDLIGRNRIINYKNWCFLNLAFLKSQTRYAQTVRFLNEILQFENNTIFPSQRHMVLGSLRLSGAVNIVLTVKTKEFAKQTSTNQCPTQWRRGCRRYRGIGGVKQPLISVV